MTLTTHPDVSLTPVKRPHQPVNKFILRMAWCEDEPIEIYRDGGRWRAEFDGFYFRGTVEDDAQDVAEMILNRLM